MGVPTLLSMAQRACVRNATGVKDVGDTRWELVQPILKKIERPSQLEMIQDASPHIAEHTAHLWKAFIERDIPNWKEKMVPPKDSRDWCKVYGKLKREDARAQQAAKENLRATMSGMAKKKEEERNMHFVETVLSEPIEEKIWFIDGVPNPHLKSGSKRSAELAQLGLGRGQYQLPSLKNATNGRQILTVLRKQTLNARRERWARQAGAMVPSAQSQITRAPEDMVRAHARRGSALSPSADRVNAKPNLHIRSPWACQNKFGCALSVQELRRRKENRRRAAARGHGASSSATRPRFARSPSPSSETASRAATPPASSSQTKIAPSVQASKAIPGKEGRPAPEGNGDTKRQLSVSPVRPTKRIAPPAPSIFIPPKKRKVK